jgi:hypothetical protein
VETLPLVALGSKELCLQAGITSRQCHYWTETRRLVGTSRGSGYPMRYDESEVAIARLLKVIIGRFDDETIEALSGAVRDGNRNVVVVAPGIIVDLAVICGPLP